ncbi:MAG: DUF4960 domain-containing protein [Muribaculaceae bacterium]|nr:DUF4960 domain-containing protein [Muribaculaceae bacterium]
MTKLCMAALLTAAGHTAAVHADRVAWFPMDVQSGLNERVSGGHWDIQGNFAPMQISLDASRPAWRTDGYTSKAVAHLGNLVDGSEMSATVWVAPDTYPIIVHEHPTEEKSEIVSCLTDNSGFGFFLGRTGHYSFVTYVGGVRVEVESDRLLPLWEWTCLSGVVSDGKVRLYAGKTLVGEADAPGNVRVADSELFIARRNDGGDWPGVNVRTFNGGIGEIAVYSNAIGVDEMEDTMPALLNLPADHYKGNRMRAGFHGQPEMNWTNETHGLIYSGGLYHLFFQKTGSAPVMTHQHWGHIVSEDLMHWRDTRPALAPGESYDIKGCWSGCVAIDRALNGGAPTIFYTGVDYAQPYLAMATATDATLANWEKSASNPIVTLKDGAESHFRDCFYFKGDDGCCYMITGTSKDGRAATMLHRLDGDSWTDLGYSWVSEDAGVDGNFAEMPNLVKLGDKWMMTTTALGSDQGVVCRYRLGSLDGGRFVPDEAYRLPRKVDILAERGFGLMSPSPSVDASGNVIAMGIVADKLPTHYNLSNGFAHLYSLPRVWTLSDGELAQAPHPMTETLRAEDAFGQYHAADVALNGTLSLENVRGRAAEIDARFTVGTSTFGINFFKNAKGRQATLSYNPATHELAVDFGGIKRWGQDEGNPNRFSAIIPADRAPREGEEFRLHLFLDRSILDIFAGDRYAASVRVFCEDDEADNIELFADGLTTVASVDAYLMDGGDHTAEPVAPKEFQLPANNGKVAFLKSSLGVSQQEQAALDFFRRTNPKGTVFETSDLSGLNTKKIDCLWIHIDRMGLEHGWEHLPAEFVAPEVVEAVQNYLEAGGNIYLTSHATQYAVAIGRLNSHYAPNEIATGEGGHGTDSWTVNPRIMQRYDHSSHAIYNDLEECDIFEWNEGTFGLLYGGGANIHREDHNCMWRLRDFHFSSEGDNRIEQFENATHSRVIGTWGQDNSDEFAGIIEFYPMQNADHEYGGTIIANGLAACQWYVEGENAYEQNLQLLTANTFTYLANPNKEEQPENPGGGEYVEPETPEIPESTGNVAMYIGASMAEVMNNEQEWGAVQLFQSLYPGATVIYGLPELINESETPYDCLWVHAERDHIGAGWQNVTGLNDEATIKALSEYLSNGGNLYLSKHAAQLVVALGRTDAAPTEFGNTDPNIILERPDHDEWQANIYANGEDWSEHTIFYQIPYIDVEHGKVIDLLGKGARHYDRNCMWKLNDFGGHDEFCRNHNARVLATWGHNGGQAWGGIIEFMPRTGTMNRAISQDRVEARKGTVVANGLAAYQIAPLQGSVNPYQDNINKLTSNILAYLSPVAEEDLSTGVAGVSTAEAPVRWFTLQGVEVVRPSAAGIYIRVCGKESHKVIVK